GFAVGGAVTFLNPTRGRLIALLACIAAVPLRFAWFIGIVPAHGVFYSLPIPHALVVAYLALLWFVLSSPHPLRFSLVLITLVCSAGAVVGWQTYKNRVV